MNYARYEHGCLTIPSTVNTNAQIVVVGSDKWNESSVEVLDVSTNSWSIVAKTPLNSMRTMSITTSKSPEFQLYLTSGISFRSRGFEKAIYGLTYSNEWKLVGNLNKKLGYHTTLNLEQNEIPGCI